MLSIEAVSSSSVCSFVHKITDSEFDKNFWVSSYWLQKEMIRFWVQTPMAGGPQRGKIIDQ